MEIAFRNNNFNKSIVQHRILCTLETQLNFSQFIGLHQNQSKYSVCSYSKCGKYIAAGGENGEFSVWDIDANKIIHEEKSNDSDAQCITAIDWNPSNSSEFAYTDNTGQFGLIENITESDENVLERDEENGMDEDIFGGSEHSSS